MRKYDSFCAGGVEKMMEISKRREAEKDKEEVMPI